MKLSILSWNTLFAGRDGADASRADLQAKVISDLAPDVFLMQEAKGFEAAGGALLHALEDRLGMRGFLALAPRTGQHVAIFIREPLRPLSFDTDGANFHHALGMLTVALPGSDRPLTLMSAHLCPNGPDLRRREAAHLAVRAAPDTLSLIAGDFNSASPHDAEPEDFGSLPSHHRARYAAEDGRADRSVLRHLESAGWVDVGYQLGGSALSTVPAAGFSGTEFATMRCDYLLASAAFAAIARSYSVIRSAHTHRASDHYPITATFEVKP